MAFVEIQRVGPSNLISRSTTVKGGRILDYELPKDETHSFFTTVETVPVSHSYSVVVDPVVSLRLYKPNF